MTADSVDLEECDNVFKGVVGTLFNEDGCLTDVNSFLNPPFRKLQPVHPHFQTKYNTSVFEFSEIFNIPPMYFNPFVETSLDLNSNPEKFGDQLPFPDFLPFPEEEDQICRNDVMNSYDTMPTVEATFEDSSHSDMESDFFLVSPNSVLPSAISNEEDSIGPLESMWPELGGLSDENLVKIVDLENIPINDLLAKKKRRKLTHLDIDHCYSQRLPVDDYEEDDDDDDFFNSSPCSPASSSCSDQFVGTRGVKRTRSKRKNARRKKIKREVISSEDEEVDVETPCSVPLVVPLVPKITISISPTLNPPPARRGRKPKDKSVGQNVKKPNKKNYPVSPKVLQEAIQQQKKKCYITKSGRITNKISNSVETSPSCSTPSSMSNSRSNSDNEDGVDKRANHNMAERNRRQELTNLFQTLRVKVPTLVENTKASKVQILKEAAEYTKELEKCTVKNLKAEMKRNISLLKSLIKSRGYSS